MMDDEKPVSKTRGQLLTIACAFIVIVVFVTWLFGLVEIIDSQYSSHRAQRLASVGQLFLITLFLLFAGIIGIISGQYTVRTGTRNPSLSFAMGAMFAAAFLCTMVFRAIHLLSRF
jgi:hypothetical protein